MTRPLAERAREAGFDLSVESLRRLDVYSTLLTRWGERMSLVGPEILADPVPAILEAIEPSRHFPPPARLLDLGSGGGLPAIPLAIAWPAGAVTLVEPRRKRWSFLIRALRELGLVGDAVERSVEEFPDIGPFNALSMRGVPDPGAWFRLLRPRVAEGGVGLLWSGEGRRSELESPGWRLERTIPLRETGHRLFVLRAFPVEQLSGGVRQSSPPTRGESK